MSEITNETPESEALDKVTGFDKSSEIKIDSNISLEEADKIYEDLVAPAFEKNPLTTDININVSEINLIEDIYNCDDENFTFNDVNLESERLKELSNKFIFKWSEMDSIEREQAIKEFVSYLSKELNLPCPPKPQFYVGEYNEYGRYNQMNNTVNFNLCHMDDPIKMLETAAHETWHAYQHMKSYSPHTSKDYLYKLNIENYVRPEQAFDIYESQLVEVEARAFADYINKKMGDALL